MRITESVFLDVFEKFKSNVQYVISVIVAVIFLILMASFPESTLFLNDAIPPYSEFNTK